MFVLSKSASVGFTRLSASSYEQLTALLYLYYVDNLSTSVNLEILDKLIHNFI